MRCKRLFHPFDYDYWHKHELGRTQRHNECVIFWYFHRNGWARAVRTGIIKKGQVENDMEKDAEIIMWCAMRMRQAPALSMFLTTFLVMCINTTAKTPKWIHQCCEYEIVILQPNGRLMNDNKCVPCVPLNSCTNTGSNTFYPSQCATLARWMPVKSWWDEDLFLIWYILQIHKQSTMATMARSMTIVTMTPC